MRFSLSFRSFLVSGLYNSFKEALPTDKNKAEEEKTDHSKGQCS